MIFLTPPATETRLVITANRRDYLETCHCGATHGGNAAQEATVLRRLEKDDADAKRRTLKVDIGPSGGPSAYAKRFAAYFEAARFDAVEPLEATDLIPKIAPIGGFARPPRASQSRFGDIVLFRIGDASPQDLKRLVDSLERLTFVRQAVAIVDHLSDVDSLRRVLGSRVLLRAVVARDAVKKSADSSGTILFPPPYQSEILSIFLSPDGETIGRKIYVEITEKEDAEIDRAIHSAQ